MKIQVNGTGLFFDVTGCSVLKVDGDVFERNSLIAIHGGPGADHLSLKPELEKLSEVCQVIFLDQRGSGRSDLSSPEYWNLKTWAKDVVDFCKQLGVGKPILFGQSFGGFVVQEIITTYPNFAKAFILSSTRAWRDDQLSISCFEKLGGKAAKKAAKNYFSEVSDENLRRFFEICLPLYNTTTKPTKKISLKDIANPELLKHFSQGESKKYDYRKRLELVTIPGLIIAGAEDPITPPQGAQEIYDSLSNAEAKLEIVEGVGHGVFRDNPHRFHQIVSDFLTSF